MASLNRVQLIGNCGQDPTMRYLPDGKAVCNVSLATTSRRKNPQTGEVTEDTQWHRLTFYERLAEIAGEYVKKGAPIYVEGKIKYGKFTNKDGVEQNTTDIIVTELQLLGSREGGQGGSQQSGQSAPRQQAPQGTPRQQAPRQDQGYQPPQGQQGYGAHRGGQAPRQAEPSRQPAQHAGGGGGGFSDMEDDIPF
jgi:single-strand DNA-binding protein